MRTTRPRTGSFAISRQEDQRGRTLLLRAAEEAPAAASSLDARIADDLRVEFFFSPADADDLRVEFFLGAALLRRRLSA
jgi:hypothetical protein